MGSVHQRPARLAFGAFEVNASTGELSKGGIGVRLGAQPFQILLILLEHPGELVTREQLREQIWGEGTFVDFEHGLNTAINKLRSALGDSAERPRYIETVPGRGYRFISTISRPFDSRPAPDPSRGAATTAPNRWRQVLLWAGFGIACVTVGFGVGWQSHGRGNEQQPPWTFVRLTADGGLSDTPALSPDNKLIAYSSEGGPGGERDLYLKHVGGGQSIRLTSDGAGNTSPDFSPDGSRILFRSNRDGGGIYEVPTFGGDIRLVAKGGLNPKSSPDGSQVAYWTGAESVAAALPGSGAVWVVPVVGGPPQRVGRNLTAARWPIWAPDGKHLLVVGYLSSKGFDSSAIDWFLVSTDGRETIRTGAYRAITRVGMQLQPNWRTPVPSVPAPSCWSNDGAIVFSNLIGDAESLWQISLSPTTGEVSGPPKRLTGGAGNEVNASCSKSGALAFANVETKSDIWLIPFDLDAGKPRGVRERISDRPGWRETVSLAASGRYVAFASYQSGQQSIWLREFATGKEMNVARSQFAERYPVSNASGDQIAFSVYEGGKRVVYVSSPGGAPEEICEGCLRATDWSRDGKNLLVFGGDPYQISSVDVRSRQRIAVVKHPQYPVLYGKFAPDNRSISFTVRVQPGRGRIEVAPYDGPMPVPQDRWITIAEAGADDYANWSPDGKTLYFTSNVDGYNCLWGQQWDATVHRPTGPVFAVQHLHGRFYFNHGGWSAAGGRIAMSLAEKTGNVWMMSSPVARGIR